MFFFDKVLYIYLNSTICNLYTLGIYKQKMLPVTWYIYYVNIGKINFLFDIDEISLKY